MEKADVWVHTRDWPYKSFVMTGTEIVMPAEIQDKDIKSGKGKGA